MVHQGCGGCSSWFRGLARQPHSEGCRERFRELMKEDAKVKNTNERKREFDEKEVERKRTKEEKKEEKKRRREGEEEERKVERRVEEIEVAQVMMEVDEWVREVTEAFQVSQVREEEDVEAMWGAWDDVHGGDLPIELVRAARKEEVEYMEKR